jgi:hypothetical protein
MRLMQAGSSAQLAPEPPKTTSADATTGMAKMAIIKMRMEVIVAVSPDVVFGNE